MTAQRKAETRARESRRPMRMSYSPLLAWVMDALRKGLFCFNVCSTGSAVFFRSVG